MGNKASQEDEIGLLSNDEVSLFAQTQHVFEELKLVLVGSHGAGKNAIGNAILRGKVFTFWKSLKRGHIDVTREVSGRRIHVSRTRGWSGDLKSQKSKRSIVHSVQSVYRTGPHAVLLVLKVDSVLSETTIRTLESLLTVELWKHTIVVFTDGEKLGVYHLEDYIRSQQLQPLIDKCGKRYTSIGKKDNDHIVETIEELIASKKASTFFKISDQDEVDLLSDWSRIVERVQSKIQYLSNYKQTLMEKLNRKAQNQGKFNKLIQSKDAEINRLKKIVQEKEREIANLRSDVQPDVSTLQRTNAILEQQLKEMNKENEELRKKLQMRREQDSIEHAEYRNELGQDVSAASRRRSHSDIQLQELPSKRSVLQKWSDTLLQVLDMLSDDQLKRMKYYMWTNEEYKIYKSSIEHKDRVELAGQMLTQWDTPRGILITRDVLKKIPYNNDDTIELLDPFLKAIGETW